MTEVVAAPDGRQTRELPQVDHWIGGTRVAGTSGRSGPVYNPATGEQTKEVAFASADEVAAKEGEAERPAPPLRSPEPRPVMERSDEPEAVRLTGTVAAGKSAPVDLLLRQTPDGPLLGFVLMVDRKRWQVVLRGQLADDVWDAVGHEGARLFNREVTVEGVAEWVEWTKDGQAMPPYRRVECRVLHTPDWTLPDAPLEAESVPMFGEPVA